MKYTPWTDGYAVGFKCEATSGKVTYIYLNPSSHEDSGDAPNAFLYYGPHGAPLLDSALTHVVID